MELHEFLLARIAEDEAVARAATKPSGFYITPTATWRVMSDTPPVPAATGWVEAQDNWVVSGEHTEDTDSGPWSQPAEIPLEIASHIARWDPARVLAECEAKRRIVEEARSYSPELFSGDNGEWAFNVVLRLLALPYADHPDYDEAWKP